MNIRAIEAVVDHVARSAKAYAATIGTALSLILTSQIHVNATAQTWLAVACTVLTGVGTFVLPNRAAGITLGQAVAQDGPIFAQAAAALKNVPLPGPVAAVVTQAEAAVPVVEQALEQAAPVVAEAAPLLEAAVPAAAPAVAVLAADVNDVAAAVTPPAA